MGASIIKTPLQPQLLFNTDTFAPTLNDPQMSFDKIKPGWKIPISEAQMTESVNFPKPRQEEVSYPQRITFKYDNDVKSKNMYPSLVPVDINIMEIIGRKSSKVKDNEIQFEDNPEITKEDNYSTVDYTTTETTEEYESTTPCDDDIVSRIAVSDTVAASLLG
ncbi:hypothetical protein O0L34_g16309 [Tuta absoluta]|nr:hypothetical protein O0L34_g16309 [Tuta absoluta]